MDHRKAQNTLSPLLKPLSLGYAAAMRLRASAYANGLHESRKPTGFCLSVGNVSWGGSGKTPLTGQLLAWAAETGLKTVVLTRGYGGKAPAHPLLVGADTPAAACGDEPRMLADQHPEAAIIVDPVRKRALALAEAELQPDLYILDDGMQHLAVQRDLNLTLLTPEDLTSGWNRVIPAGSWREDQTALKRADAFMLRASEQDFPSIAAIAAERLAKYEKPLFSFDLKPLALLPLAAPLRQTPATAPPATTPARHGAQPSDNKTEPAVNNLSDRPYALCTAVGTPDSVRRSVTEFTGRAPQREFIFPDHYAYRAQDLADMSLARLPLVTTAKDAVKLRPLLSGFPDLEILVLQAGVVFGPTLFTYALKDIPGDTLRPGPDEDAVPLFRRWLAGRFQGFMSQKNKTS
ncbi:MAG: tetraacyldisaccharide 4'-kinase [Deltaproteobacteria bacterium]|jgi:tetraacyldisaccharide 4'-kinase|nr:tetraacyldisaccharide 4'-kinase [Deltaproteobacteria bacterium]